MLACANRIHGPLIIPLLIDWGVDVTATNSQGFSSYNFALNSNREIVLVLESLLTPLQKQACLAHISSGQGNFTPDPLGAIDAAGIYVSTALVDKIAAQHDPPSLWACLRHGGHLCLDGSASDVFACVENSRSARFWQLAVADLCGVRHPLTGDTILHCAARAGSLPGVLAYFRRNGNPFVLNFKCQSALDVSSTLEVSEIIRTRSIFQPANPLTVDWFGPWFLIRARTWMLVCQRWSSSGVRRVSKDIRLLVTQHIAASETVWARLG